MVSVTTKPTLQTATMMVGTVGFYIQVVIMMDWLVMGFVMMRPTMQTAIMMVETVVDLVFWTTNVLNVHVLVELMLQMF